MPCISGLNRSNSSPVLLSRYRSAHLFLLLLLIALPARPAESTNPAISLKSVSAEGVDLDKRTVDLKITVEVKNPGPKFKLKDLHYRVKLNGEDAAEGKSKKDIDIAAESTSSLDLPLTVKLNTLPSVTWTAITDGFKVKYELQTEGTVPLFASLTRKLKLDSNGEVSLGQAISNWYSKVKDRLTK